MYFKRCFENTTRKKKNKDVPIERNVNLKQKNILKTKKTTPFESTDRMTSEEKWYRFPQILCRQENTKWRLYKV